MPGLILNILRNFSYFPNKYNLLYIYSFSGDRYNFNSLCPYLLQNITKYILGTKWEKVGNQLGLGTKLCPQKHIYLGAVVELFSVILPIHYIYIYIYVQKFGYLPILPPKYLNFSFEQLHSTWWHYRSGGSRHYFT